MKVYFVRHAETAYNIEKIHQPAQAPLSPCGIKQAHIVGRKFLSLPIDVILSSPNARARKTAEIVSGYTHVKIVSLYQLRETRRPSSLLGKRKDSRESEQVSNLFFKNAADYKWYFSDEENFCDLVDRAKRVIRYIQRRQEENILVVTHSTFLKLIITVMMHGDNLTAEMFRSFVKFFGTKNTGITLVQGKENGKWRLITWNDYTHLRIAKQLLDGNCSKEKRPSGGRLS